LKTKRSLQNLARLLDDFARERDWAQFHSPKNLSMALIVEAAELLEHFQWLTESQSLELSPDKLRRIREEVADVLIYLTRLSDRLGIDPLSAAYDKVEANRAKYPAERVRGKAKKYSEYEDG
jgi:dCTP diphosphatase